MNNSFTISDVKIPPHIHITRGDITTFSVDAIVNAANKSLLGGGGVDGAIHKAAGHLLLVECRSLGGCNTGEAKITKGYNLPAKHVIHTPGPVYRGGNYQEQKLLSDSYRNSISLSHIKSLESIAFPSISTGVYGYPKKEACSIALTTVLSYMQDHVYYPDVFFVLFDNESYEIYLDTYKKFLARK
jgi:O-acetyl-ADP-ribose deacetylase (regulator of RNase III)